MLTIIQVGNNPASNTYIKNKVKAVEKEGLESELIRLEESATTEDVIKEIYKAHLRIGNTAIMVQLPLPAHINKDSVLNGIPQGKDIDGLNKKSNYMPLTACAIIRWLDDYISVSYGEDLRDKHVVIFGRSELVGKPLADLLIEKGATVSVVNSKTSDKTKEILCSCANVIVSATGNMHTLKPYYIQSPVTVIDVGINRNADGKVCGDVDAEVRQRIADLGGYCTPVPRGVGKWTVNELVIRLKKMEGRK